MTTVHNESPADKSASDFPDTIANSDAMAKTDLRVQSLVLASFPWKTSVIMSPEPLSQSIKEDHYAFVSYFFPLINYLCINCFINQVTGTVDR